MIYSSQNLIVERYIKLQYIKLYCILYIYNTCILHLQHVYFIICLYFIQHVLGAEIFILNSDCIIFLAIMWAENTVENVVWIFPKTADESYLVKIGLIMHHKSLQTDIAHNSVNRSRAEQYTRTN